MRLLRRRRLLVCATALTAGAAIAIPLTWGQVGSASQLSFPTANAAFDEIQYNQQTGSSGNYLAFVPATVNAGNEKAATQSMVGGGGCSPGPIVVNPGNPLLAISASLFASGTAENVGAYKYRTGVCIGSSGGDQAIDTGEALTFHESATSPAGANRIIADAQVVVARADKAGGDDFVQLLEFSGGTQVATETFDVTASQGTPVILDTNCGAFVGAPVANTCFATTGSVAGGFDAVEVANPAALNSSSNVSVAVVPSSIFYLANEICVGTPITATSTNGSVASGQVSATFALQGASGFCKSYTGFGATASDPSSPTNKSVSFFSQSVGGAQIQASVDWGYFPLCAPDQASATAQGIPVCPTTTVSFDGTSYSDQTYCATYPAPGAVPPWCTTDKNFQNVVVNGAQETHITETWDGTGDPVFRG